MTNETYHLQAVMDARAVLASTVGFLNGADIPNYHRPIADRIIAEAQAILDAPLFMASDLAPVERISATMIAA